LTCWGLNNRGEATPPTDLGLVVDVAAGYGSTCAVDVAGVVWCWGNDELAQTVPPHGGALPPAAAVTAGVAHACSLDVLGDVRCWGYSSVTTVPSGLSNVVKVTAGSLHTCALDEDGRVTCWGSNTYGQLTVP